MKKYTREELIKKIKKNDVSWFSRNYFENDWNADKKEFTGNKFRTCWEINWGDGNEWIIALNFFEDDLIVVMEGYYSSHGESEFDRVGVGIPYEFKETRYRIATTQELRDLNLDNILSGKD